MLIARKFLREFAKEEGKRFLGFSREAESLFLAYSWPGNVRQLQNVIRNIVVLHDGELVMPAMLPAPINQLIPAPTISTVTLSAEALHGVPIKPMWLVEKETIENAIEQCDGNIPLAATMLELSPSTIYRKRVAWTVS